jgi:hypothetical protein
MGYYKEKSRLCGGSPAAGRQETVSSDVNGSAPRGVLVV